MKLMSYNIFHCENYLEHRLDISQYAEYILRQSPDICALNEVRGAGDLVGYSDQTAQLAARTGYFGYFGEAIKVKGKAPYGNALLSRLELEGVELVKIPDPPRLLEGCYETRAIIKAIANIEGRRIMLLHTHMGLMEAERENAVGEIMRLAEQTSLPIILTGDFNDEPNSLILSPLYDIFEDAEKNTGRPTFTYSSVEPQKKIDYILYRGLECRSFAVLDVVLSDHYPIIAEFE